MNESTCVGYVHPGEVNGYFHESLIDLLVADERRGGTRDRIIRNGGIIAEFSGPRIAAARNNLVRAMLKTNAQWLLMVDTDMVFTPENVDALFREAHPRTRPIVGGLCFGGGRSGVMFPTLYVLEPPDEDHPDPVRIIKDYPENAMVQVHATGAAFLLIHRRVLEEMQAKYGEPYPWFIEGSVYRGISFGEDWAFCMRAHDMGIPIYVNTAAQIGHVKPQILDAAAWKDYKQLEDEIGEEGIKAAHRRRIGAESE